MKFIQIAERVPGHPKIVSVQVVWGFLLHSCKTSCFSLAFFFPSLSLSLLYWLQGSCTTHCLCDRIHTACFVELLIREWLSAVTMRGSFVFDILITEGGIIFNLIMYEMVIKKVLNLHKSISWTNGKNYSIRDCYVFYLLCFYVYNYCLYMLNWMCNWNHFYNMTHSSYLWLPQKCNYMISCSLCQKLCPCLWNSLLNCLKFGSEYNFFVP